MTTAIEPAEHPATEQAACCIVGGGPAGVMLGFLLARQGIDVLVLEKHKDFFRDFRGDTIHPSTLELMYELGLLDEFLARPHQELRQIEAHFGERRIHLADFTHLPTHCKFIAFMPQWDFLDFLSGQARKFPNFRLRMEARVTELIQENDRVVGVKASTPDGPLEVRTNLVIGADGRSSTVRQAAGLKVVDLGSPIDVLWFRVSKRPGDPPQAFGFVCAGQFMVLIDRADYWQCAYVIRKGSFERTRSEGLESFHRRIGRCAPFLANRTAEITTWDDVKLLSVKVDHLRTWCREGLLCIGDSAHAMSPVGGVGINLAIQDAVATANLLGPALRNGRVELKDLQAVQRRRERPARLTQRVQVFLHRHLLEPLFDSTETPDPPLLMKFAEKFPALRRIPARMVGIGSGRSIFDDWKTSAEQIGRLPRRPHYGKITIMSERQVRWVGRSREDLRRFPDEVRRDIGFALEFAQRGEKHPSAKPLKGFGGAGVLEIVEDRRGDAYRAVYTVRFGQAVYVLHVFMKKSTSGIKTPKHELALIERRLKAAEADCLQWQKGAKA